MAIRQLMLSKKIEQRKAALAELMKTQDSLNQRSADLETAIGEAKTDEEMAVVEEETEKLEADQKDFDEKKSKLEGEIADLEGELDELNSNEPKPEPSPEPKPADPARSKNLGGDETRMVRYKFFGDMSRNQVDTLLKREDVKEFLNRTRELIREKRAVSGAELNIPDVMLELLRDNLNRYSKLITKIYVKPVSGKARQNISGSIPEGIWMEAVGSLNELSLKFNQIEVDGYKVGGFVPISNSTLEDSDLNLANEIMDALGQAIGYAVDKAILFGTGKKMPLGISTRLAQTSAPETWGTYAPDWADLHTSNILKIDPTSMTAQEFFAALIVDLGVARPNYAVGKTFWAMNRKTKMALMAKSIVFNAAGAIVAGQMGSMPVEGGDIVELPFIADNDIIGGYGSLYLLAERAGAKLASSEHVRFLEDQTVFKGTARYDGAPVFGEGFVIVNIANSTPTTSVAFSPDEANIEDVYLSGLTIGALSLSPAFNGAVTTYTAATTDATNKITATAKNAKATVAIKVNDADFVNGSSATWNAGANTVQITVSYGTTTAKIYTVTVTKS